MIKARRLKRQVPIFKFDEVRDWDQGGGYTISNEDLSIHQKLTKGLKMDRAAGICAGGEIPLLTFGPHCKELILVDHGLQGLAVAALKLHLLARIGPAEFLALLTKATDKEIVEHTKRLVPKLPTELLVYSPNLTLGSAPSLAAYWKGVDVATVKQLKALIPKITLVHGDIRDLKNYGKFDIIYGSNAIHDHHGYDNKTPKPNDLVDILKTSGHILYTGYGPNSSNPGYDLVKQEICSNWTYYLLKKQAQTLAQAA